MEGSHPLRIAAHDLPINQAGPHLEVVHRLHDEREVVVQSFLPPSNQPDAHGITPRHEPVAVVLDLVNPIGAGRAGGQRGNARQGGMNAEGIA